MFNRLLALCALVCLWLPTANAQHVRIPISGPATPVTAVSLDLPTSGGATYASTTLDLQPTDSSATVPTPVIPVGSTLATIVLNHRARFYFGTETNFVLNWGSGWCDYQVSSTITQGISIYTNGVQLGNTQRAHASFSRAGQCLPFDGVYDWGGASGWNSGYIWRPTTITVAVPIAQLGPTITVTTNGRSNFTMDIACFLTSIPSDMTGTLVLLNQSWWEGDIDIVFS